MVAVAKFGPESCPTPLLKDGGDMKSNHAEYPPTEDQTKNASWQRDYFLEKIDYFAMSMEVDPSEGDRHALAVANPERKMGKRKKLSARKDVQESALVKFHKLVRSFTFLKFLEIS